MCPIFRLVEDSRGRAAGTRSSVTDCNKMIVILSVTLLRNDVGSIVGLLILVLTNIYHYLNALHQVDR